MGARFRRRGHRRRRVGVACDEGWSGLHLASGHVLDAGTVDYLREIAPGGEGGAYIRAIPRPGGGSVVVMTLPLLLDAERTAVAATLRDELNALVSLVEST